MVARPALARKPKASTRPKNVRARALTALFGLISLLAAGPTGCLSDIEFPPACADVNECGGKSAQAGQNSDAGESPTGGTAGTPPPPFMGMAGAAGGDDAGAAGSPNADAGNVGAENLAAKNGGAGNGGAGNGGAGNGGVAGNGGAVGSGLPCNDCRLAPPQLPHPCGSEHYTRDFSVFGGTGPYQWQVASTTGSWQIAPQPNSADSSQARLTGDPAGSTLLTVTVIDGLGFFKQNIYSLIPRTSCKIAYVYSDLNGAKLSVRDPLLDTDASANLAHNVSVYDFRFSPNGRFLAYRFGKDDTHPLGAHLSLFDFSTMQDQALTFQEDAVNAFAWSPDSKVLAVALTKANGQSQLTGVRPTSTASGIELNPLTAVVAVDPIQSDLYWVGSQFVGFHTADTPDLETPPGRSTIFYAQLVSNTFTTPAPIIDALYRPGLVVMTAPGGLFAVGPLDKRTYFNAIGSFPAYTVYHESRVIDPGGNYSARVADKLLQVFEAADVGAANNEVPFQTSSAAAEHNCPKLLTWASKRERVACVAHVAQANASWGELRIFEVGTDKPPQILPSVVKGSCLKDAQGTPLASCSSSEYDYDELTSAAQPRALSPSGDWLAFVTGAQSGAASALYWADLRATTKTLSRKFGKPAMAAGLPNAFGFSPSERYLLHQNGKQLMAHLLSADPQGPDDLEVDPALDASASAPCSEDFVTAPTRWCGGVDASQAFVWSPDPSSELFAYRKAEMLIAVELTPHTLARHELAAPACNGSCSGQFAFQPPIP